MSQNQEGRFEIPLDKLCFPDSIEKKEEIEQIILKDNKLENKYDFEEVKSNIDQAIRDYDYEYIKVLLLPTIQIDKFTFKIDRENHIAILFGINGTTWKDEVTVPHHIEHKSINYIVTGIAGSYSREKTIGSLNFPENSEVRTIYPNSFYRSVISHLFIPKSLIELKNYWCYQVNNLTSITISPLNTNFQFLNHQLLLGKSDPKSDNFDVLLFSVRSITNPTIPADISIISPCAFSSCKKLSSITFPTNSKLTKIERLAFSNSNLCQISIPPHLSKIGDYAFSECGNLTVIFIPENSELKSIGCFAFQYTQISKIFIPQSLTELVKGWNGNAYYLKSLEVSPLNKNFQYKHKKFLIGKSDPKSDNFDILLYANLHISDAFIPPYIKIISEYAFDHCSYLCSVNFSENSILQSIESHAFLYSDIRQIRILPNVTKIGKGAFSRCSQLKLVEIPSNSQLKSIGEGAFLDTSIKKIFIPPLIKTIESSTFYICEKLHVVEFAENSQLQSIEFESFMNTLLNKITIPQHVSKIDINAFNQCRNLKIVEFHENSELKSIESSAFAFTNIHKIVIPSSVTLIGRDAFNQCRNLKIVEFHENSKLESIGSSAFSSTDIRDIVIPSSVSFIGQDVFCKCSNLQIIEISEGTEMELCDIRELCYIFKTRTNNSFLIMFPSSTKK